MMFGKLEIPKILVFRGVPRVGVWKTGLETQSTNRLFGRSFIGQVAKICQQKSKINKQNDEKQRVVG